MIIPTRHLILSIGIVLSIGNMVTAQPSRERSTKKAQAAAKQSAKAARVFEQIMATRERSIPRDLLRRAEAVAVFPGVLKAGFIVGGRGGSGVISRRRKDGWGGRAVFDLPGGHIGLENCAGASRY